MLGGHDHAPRLGLPIAKRLGVGIDRSARDASSLEPQVQGVRRAHELIAREPRVAATTLQTVGAKGWDGLTLVLRDAHDPESVTLIGEALRTAFGPRQPTR